MKFDERLRKVEVLSTCGCEAGLWHGPGIDFKSPNCWNSFRNDNIVRILIEFQWYLMRSSYGGGGGGATLVSLAPSAAANPNKTKADVGQKHLNTNYLSFFAEFGGGAGD